MKQELLNNTNLILYKLNNVYVRGEENIANLRDSFMLLHGMAEYLSTLPDDETSTEDAPS